LLQSRLARRQQWLHEAAAALASSPALEAVEALLREASVMQIQDKLCDQLQRLATSGHAWQGKAEDVLSSSSTHSLEHVTELISAGKALSLQLVSIEALETAVSQAWNWQEQADQLLAQGRRNGSWQPDMCASPEELSGTLERPEASLLLLPQAKELRDELRRIRLVGEVQRMLLQHPQLDDVRTVLDEMNELSMEHLPDVVEVQKRCTAASKWAQRANIALRRRTGLGALESLQQEASGLAVQLEQQAEVEQRITTARDWSTRARQAIEGRADVETVRTLLEQGEQLDVTIPEEETIAGMVKAVDWWTKRASSAFLKRGCNISLLEVLRANPKDLLDEAAPGSSSSGTAGLACLYCTGNDTATLNRFMIGCDECRRWYHGPCVSVGKGAADSMDDYLCPLCAGRKGVAYAFGPPIPVPKYTRRPRLRYVTSLLGEAGEIGVDMQESALISALQAKAEAWQLQAQHLLDTDDDLMDPTAVDALVREGDACEVEPEALAQLRKLRQQLSVWQQRALSVLEGQLDVDAPLIEEEAEVEQELAEQSMKQRGCTLPPPDVAMLSREIEDDEEEEDDDDEAGRCTDEGSSARAKDGSPPDSKAEQVLSPAAQRRSSSAEELLVSDVPWLSRDHMRAILRKEAVPCKASKAEMQAQVSALILLKKGESVDGLDMPLQVDQEPTEASTTDTHDSASASATDGATKRTGKEKQPKRFEKGGARGREVALNSLAGVQMLISEAHELHIACSELEQLQEMAARAQRWRIAAREALDDAHEVTEAQLDALLKELAGLPLRLQERGLLQRKLSRKRWLLARRQQLGAALDGVPHMAYLKEAVSEASELGLDDVDEVLRAQVRIEAAEEWIELAKDALSAEANIHVLKGLRDDAALLRISLELLEAVQQRIEDSQDWGNRAVAALEKPTSLKHLRTLLTQAERAAVPLAQRAQLLERESIAEWWQQRASAAFIKFGCKLGLIEVLQSDGHFDLVGEDGNWCATLACSFCTGEDLAETSQFMIGCDECGRWYHGPCVGVGKAEADALDDYLCPTCASAKHKEYAFGVPPMPKLTRRPCLRFVKALLQEAADLGIEIPEALLISDACEKAQHWQKRARAHLVAIEEARASLSATNTLVQDGSTLEVVPELLGYLQRYVQLREEWSESVNELRNAPQEQKRGAAVITAAWDGLESAFGLEAQAALLHIPEQESTRLASALDTGTQWQAAARSALNASSHAPPSAGVQQLLATSDVHVSPEFEQLKLAVGRQEMLPALQDHLIEPPASMPQPDDNKCAVSFLHAQEEVL